MRWDALFEDLEAQWSGQQAVELEAEVAETLELERARLQLADRLRAGIGEKLNIRLRGGVQLRLQLSSLGADWVSGTTGAHSVLIPLRALTGVDGLPRRAEPEVSHTRSRLNIGSPLRALARSRTPVIIQGVDGELGSGMLSHVGADHVDLVLNHHQGSGSSGNSLRRTVPLSAVVALTSS